MNSNKEPSSVMLVALYKFVALPDFKQIREPLLQYCEGLNIKGTLLLAHEGINGTVSGSQKAMHSLIEYLQKDPRLADLDYKCSFDNDLPFYRMKVKLKKEIVTMGVEDIDPRVSAGTYVSPKEWNALIADPEVIVIDTRNDYEVEIGTFEGAVNPNTQSFREIPEYIEKHLDPKVNKKVAMFCTGGIRCEKSTAYLKKKGFNEVFHLQGGILKYLEEMPEKNSLWRGECFVFDNRVAVNHQLEKGSYDLCHGCRFPITEADKMTPEYHKGVSCPRCHDRLTQDQKRRFLERQKQMDLARARGEQHIGNKQR